MRAIVLSHPGGPEVLALREAAMPIPSRGEIRVRVRATAVNRADLLQRQGKYPAPAGSPADILGLEFAGEVDCVGEGVDEFVPGARVFGLVGGGAYAEYVVVHARTVARIPEGIAFVDAAAVPEAFITAWDAAIDQADLRAGETLLVHAVGSGVGTAATQIARAVGARPLGTGRSESKLKRASECGLHEHDAILVENGRFVDDVLARTSRSGVDVVLDLVGGPYTAQNVACLAHRGRIVVVGTLAGTKADLDLRTLMQKRARIMGTMLRSRPLEEKIGCARILSARIAPLLARGSLKPVIDRVLPLDRVADAHVLVERNETFGKVVLEV